MMRIVRPTALLCTALALAMTVAMPARAQDKPRSGGELVFVVPAEPPTYDGHREGTRLRHEERPRLEHVEADPSELRA